MSIASMVNSVNLANLWGVDPFKPKEAPDASGGWWNNAVTPVKTNIKDWQDYGKPAPTYQTYGQSAPKYQGLAGGDYQRLEANMRAPGETAARTAYDEARRMLGSSANARGMYGSSDYTRQMADKAFTPYVNAVSTNAANAATQRYGMQQQDLQFGQQQSMQEWLQRMAENANVNQMGYNTWNALLNQNTARNQYGLQQALGQNQIDTNYANFLNNIQRARYDDAWDRANFGSRESQRVWQNLLGLAEGTDQYKDSQNALTVSRMSKANQESSGIGGLLGSVGSIAGQILGGPIGGQIGSGLSSLFGGGGSVNFLDGAKPGTDWSGQSGSGVSGSTRFLANY